jgi:hypothetical protein
MYFTDEAVYNMRLLYKRNYFSPSAHVSIGMVFHWEDVIKALKLKYMRLETRHIRERLR